MKFTNAYDLTKFLFKEGLFAGVDLYIRGEFVLDTKVKDAKLLDLLHEIWSEWEWGEQGFYELALDDNDDLKLSISVCEDLRECYGEIFPQEKILKFVNDFLILENIDEEEDLIYQMSIDLEFEYDKDSSQTKLIKHSLNSLEDSELSTELSNKKHLLETVEFKSKLLKFLEDIQYDICGSYVGFDLTIEDGFTETHIGYGSEELDNLKEFLKNHSITFEICDSLIEPSS